MFAWLTDVFASSGFFHGEAWALEKQRNWTELKHAFRLWWPVTAVRAPFLWASAFVGRHPKLGVWSRRLWVVGGCAVLGWFGPGWLYPWLPVPLPGVIGWIATVVLFLAFVFYVPRIRGMAILRPVKAACVVAVLYAVYWALASATFHYTYGVDVWSYTLWEDIAAVWNRGGNLRWSAFWLLVVDTAAWVVLIVFVWTRVSRVWVAFKAWGLCIMIWVMRAVVFFTLTYLVATAFGYGVWQLADELARALASFPYGAETIGKAPAWALLAVVFVFGLVVLNMAIIVLETVSDVLCLVSKLFNIVVHGGILNADKVDDPDVKPRRIVGIVERFERSHNRMAEGYAAYTRQRLISAIESGITDDGFDEHGFEYREEGFPPAPPREKRRKRGWWPFGRAAEAEPEEGAPAVHGAATGAASGAPPGVSEGAPDTDDGFDLPGAEDEVEAAPIPVPDTTDRDAFLAPDPVDAPDSSGALAAGEDAHGAPPDESHGASESTSAASPHVDEEAEALELERARAEERQFAAEDSAEDHRHDLRQAQLASTSSDYDRYADDSDYDLLGHEDDDDDPFDPSAERDDFESGQGEFYSGEPPVPSGPFGTPFPPEEGTGEGGGAAPEPLAEEDAPRGFEPGPQSLEQAFVPEEDSTGLDASGTDEEELLEADSVSGESVEESSPSGGVVDADGAVEEDSESSLSERVDVGPEGAGDGADRDPSVDDSERPAFASGAPAGVRGGRPSGGVFYLSEEDDEVSFDDGLAFGPSVSERPASPGGEPSADSGAGSATVPGADTARPTGAGAASPGEGDEGSPTAPKPGRKPNFAKW